jgi:uncharacterized phage-associated protein
MYYAWKLHHVLPSVYNNLGYGEKKILGVFISKEIEDKNKEIESMSE